MGEMTQSNELITHPNYANSVIKTYQIETCDESFRVNDLIYVGSGCRNQSIVMNLLDLNTVEFTSGHVISLDLAVNRQYLNLSGVLSESVFFDSSATSSFLWVSHGILDHVTPLPPGYMAKVISNDLIYTITQSDSNVNLLITDRFGYHQNHVLLYCNQIYGMSHHEVSLWSGKLYILIGQKILNSSVLTDSVMEVDIDTLQSSVVFNLSDHIRPNLRLGLEDSINNNSFSYYPAGIICGTGQILDWSHCNSFKHVESDEGWVLSCPRLNSVLYISEDFGKIIWKLGGHGSTFNLDRNDEFLFQHSVRMSSNKTVLMFDNGAPTRGVSRGLELSLDYLTLSASSVWSYITPSRVYSFCCGSIIKYQNNYIIDFPRNEISPSPVSLFSKVSGDRVKLLTVAHTSFTTYRIDLVRVIDSSDLSLSFRSVILTLIGTILHFVQ